MLVYRAALVLCCSGTCIQWYILTRTFAVCGCQYHQRVRHSNLLQKHTIDLAVHNSSCSNTAVAQQQSAWQEHLACCHWLLGCSCQTCSTLQSINRDHALIVWFLQISAHGWSNQLGSAKLCTCYIYVMFDVLFFENAAGCCMKPCICFTCRCVHSVCWVTQVFFAEISSLVCWFHCRKHNVLLWRMA